MLRWSLVAVTMSMLMGCAALGPRTEGTAGPVKYRATDLELARRTVNSRDLWVYSFSVHVTELSGHPLVFHEITTTVYQPGAGPWSPVYRGTWTLPAHGEFRIPLRTTLMCHPTAGSCGGPHVPMPLWQFTMVGTDDTDKPVRLVLDLTLPADPSSVPVATSKSVPAIALTPPPQTPGAPR